MTWGLDNSLEKQVVSFDLKCKDYRVRWKLFQASQISHISHDPRQSLVVVSVECQKGLPALVTSDR